LQLNDLKQLQDYGITDGAILAHARPVGHRSSSSVNYAEIAKHLINANSAKLGGGADPDDWSPDADNNAWDGKWAGMSDFDLCHHSVKN
jgi:hypothetical protein